MKTRCSKNSSFTYFFISFPLSRLRVEESLDAFLTNDRQELEMVIMDITRMFRHWQMLMKFEDVDSLY